MTGITRAPLELIQAGNSPGDVVNTGQGLQIQQGEMATELNGTFDNTTGTLRLSIPGLPVLRIDGFMTQSDVGTGREGVQGPQGTSGIDGIIGESGLQGKTGCRGPQGPQGTPGPRGPRGQQGEQGSVGATGGEGIPGLDGRVSIYISQDDPGAVGAGAIWIKPS
jgi:hypothetical protein